MCKSLTTKAIRKVSKGLNTKARGKVSSSSASSSSSSSSTMATTDPALLSMKSMTTTDLTKFIDDLHQTMAAGDYPVRVTQLYTRGLGTEPALIHLLHELHPCIGSQWASLLHHVYATLYSPNK
jgi:hypothetical protein